MYKQPAFCKPPILVNYDFPGPYIPILSSYRACHRFTIGKKDFGDRLHGVFTLYARLQRSKHRTRDDLIQGKGGTKTWVTTAALDRVCVRVWRRHVWRCHVLASAYAKRMCYVHERCTAWCNETQVLLDVTKCIVNCTGAFNCFFSKNQFHCTSECTCILQ